MNLVNRIKSKLEQDKTGLLLFGVLGIITIGGIGIHAAALNASPLPFISTTTTTAMLPLISSSQGVSISAQLSQTKFVQYEPGKAYINISISTPEDATKAAARQPTDMIVVLDHSGSMSADNRLPYAKAAITNLLSRLSPEDRFALVVFDSSAYVASGLTPVTPDQQNRLSNLVNGIQLGSGTNIGGGIQLARSLIARDSSRSTRILLLSDGEANEGITNPAELGNLAAGIQEYRSVLSAIGMGLGFNENLMASLADRGGGTFSFLEHLEKLGDILDRDLKDARNVFAAKSTVEFDLPVGVRISDAAGYPVQMTGSAPNGYQHYVIPVGQILSGATKRFFVTLDIPTNTVGENKIASVVSRIEHAGGPIVLAVSDIPSFSVVPQVKRADAIASIDKDVWKEAWQKNNYGMLQRNLNSALKAGDSASANEAVARYRDEIRQQEAASGVPLMDAELDKKIKKDESSLVDAFAGAPMEQKEKQNRYGKAALGSMYESQRQMTK